MRNRSRPVAALILALAAPLAMGATPARSAHVLVSVTDLRNEDGVVIACMTSDPERFPRCRGDADSYRLAMPAREGMVLDFGAVRPGRYAIALLHDENENGKADRALSMIPREGFGFSRDAKVRMGPPRFQEAAMEIGSAPVRTTIRMRYML